MLRKVNSCKMQLSEHSTAFQAGCQGWRILNELATTGKTTLSDKQVGQFIDLMDIVADRLRPVRRPQDLDQPECSQQELKALAALGQRQTLTMSELAATLKVPLSTATRMIDKLVVKNLVERPQQLRQLSRRRFELAAGVSTDRRR